VGAWPIVTKCSNSYNLPEPEFCHQPKPRQQNRIIWSLPWDSIESFGESTDGGIAFAGRHCSFVQPRSIPVVKRFCYSEFDSQFSRRTTHYFTPCPSSFVWTAFLCLIQPHPRFLAISISNKSRTKPLVSEMFSNSSPYLNPTKPPSTRKPFQVMPTSHLNQFWRHEYPLPKLDFIKILLFEGGSILRTDLY
jgi:hypothetical protein